MMVIQVLLIAAIVLTLGRFLAFRDSLHVQAGKKILLLLFAVIAIAMILSPRLLDGLAHFVGVGRGTDLLLYALTVAFIFGQLSNYAKAKAEDKKIVVLARKIAIMEAQHKRGKKNG